VPQNNQRELRPERLFLTWTPPPQLRLYQNLKRFLNVNISLQQRPSPTRGLETIAPPSGTAPHRATANRIAIHNLVAETTHPLTRMREIGSSSRLDPLHRAQAASTLDHRHPSRQGPAQTCSSVQVHINHTSLTLTPGAGPLPVVPRSPLIIRPLQQCSPALRRIRRSAPAW